MFAVHGSQLDNQRFKWSCFAQRAWEEMTNKPQELTERMPGQVWRSPFLAGISTKSCKINSLLEIHSKCALPVSSIRKSAPGESDLKHIGWVNSVRTVWRALISIGVPWRGLSANFEHIVVQTPHCIFRTRAPHNDGHHFIIEQLPVLLRSKRHGGPYFRGS